jgi:hypothetical protein
MTTLIEKLRAMAAEFEQDAESIRTTLRLLDHKETAGALVNLNGKLKQAVSLRRKVQSQNHQRSSPRPPKGDFSIRVTTILRNAGKPLTTDELRTAMLAAGFERAQMRGLGMLVRNGYIKATGPEKRRMFHFRKMPQYAPVSEPRRSTKLTKTIKGSARISASRPKSTLGPSIAKVLQEADRPLTAKEISATLRARRLPDKLTGIVNYVRAGMIKRHGDTRGHFTYSVNADAGAAS